MFRFDFSTADLAHTSLALSPLWELVCSLRVLQMPDPDGLYQSWIGDVRPRLTQLPDLELLRALVPVGNYLPDFLTPPPDSPLPDLDSELQSLLHATEDQVRRDLFRAHPLGLPEVLRSVATDPQAGLRRTATALRAYWDCALAQWWPEVRDVLQGDIVYRGREFASGGASRLFSDLHPTVSWSNGSLLVDKDRSLRLDLGGAGLLLLPSAFAWPAILTITAPPLRPTLIYPARGVGTLWADDQPSPRPAGLARLLGRQRARLLSELSVPSTTTQLARRIAITSGGASQQLSILHDAGLVLRTRSGRVVLYARTPLGDTLAENLS